MKLVVHPNGLCQVCGGTGLVQVLPSAAPYGPTARIMQCPHCTSVNDLHEWLREVDSVRAD